MKILLLLLLLTTSAQAEIWITYDNKSYLGGYYFAVCNICNSGSYNNDLGYWACTDADKVYEKGCAKGIWQAIMNSEELVTEY